MCKRSVIGLVLSAVLTGCAGVPAFDTPSPLTVAHVIDRIQCEVWQSANQHSALRKERWVAVANLYLQVDDSVGLTPTVSFIEPLATVGTTFTFGASGALKGARQRIYNESFELDIARLRNSHCDAPKDNFSLTGELGIVETVNLGMGSIGPDDAARYAAKESFGQTIQFVVTKNVNAVGPTWTLVRFSGPGGLFGAERVDTHKLIISFAPGEVKGKAKSTVRLPAAERARQQNLNMLLQSLPAFRNAR